MANNEKWWTLGIVSGITLASYLLARREMRRTQFRQP